ncbi:hypothetical protein [Reyranella sp.]|uniref:hypothetical protein n=1 Tax=Reyranella sp. TaxID=1929291 RepID=UPI004036E192
MKPRDVTTTKGAVSALFDQIGGIKEAMFRLEISQTRAYAFADPMERESHISFDRVAALTSPTSTAAAEFLCFRAGGIYLPVVDKASCRTPELVEIADQAKANGEAVSALLHAVHDGSVTAAERQQVLPRIDEALRGLARLRACIVAEGDQ